MELFVFSELLNSVFLATVPHNSYFVATNTKLVS